MTTTNLVGIEVIIVVSDPWEFLTEHGTGPFIATVIQIGADQYVPGKKAILLQLKNPLIYNGLTCEYFIASPRLEGRNITALATGGEVYCGLTRIPADRAISSDPFDLSWWRGGVALVATLHQK